MSRIKQSSNIAQISLMHVQHNNNNKNNHHHHNSNKTKHI